MAITVQNSLFFLFFIFPFIGYHHVLLVDALIKYNAPSDNRIKMYLTTFVPYIVIWVCGAWGLALSIGEDTFVVDFIMSMLLIFLVAALYASAIGLVGFRLGLEPKVEQTIAVTVISKTIKKKYSLHAASMVELFFAEGFLAVDESEGIVKARTRDMPKGHENMGEAMKRIVYALIDNQGNDTMRAIINDALVREERINKLAFVMTIIRDAEKYDVVTETHLAECSDYFDVFKDIAKEIAGEVATYQSLEGKTIQTTKELKKSMIQREIIALKNSSDTLSLQ